MKKWIWLLSIIMAVTMVGLIMVQYFWIKSALFVRQNQFDHMVRRALFQVINDLEIHTTWNSVSSNFIYGNENNNLVNSNFEYQIQSSNDTFQIKFEYDGTKGILKTNKSPEANLYLWSDSIKDYVNIYDTIAHDKTYFLNPQTGRLQVVGDDSSSKAVIVQAIVDKMINTEKSKLENNFDTNAWRSIIQRDLQNNGIPVDFEYMVRNADNQVIYKSKNFPKSSNEDCYEVMLFRNDFFNKPYYLHIYFPKKTKALLGTFGPIASSSIILMLIIMGIFTGTLVIIFKQKKLGDMKNDFVNNMTHELKTPISTVLLATQMLKDDSIPAEIKNTPKLSQLIEDETKRLSYQVEKILQMAAFDKGHINFKIKKIDVNEIAQSVLDNFRINIQNRNGEIHLHLDAPNPEIDADEHHLKNVLFNLLDNAVKYSREKPYINITTHNNKQGVIVSIQDKGIGMSKDDVKKIFEKFYRVPTGNRHDVKGFGLGLSYVKKVVEQHNGTIHVESTPNIGTTFKIILPFSQNKDKKQQNGTKN